MTIPAPLAPLRRRAAAVSAPLLLALALTGCGGSDTASAPDDASVEDFCAAFTDLASGMSTESDSDAVAAANTYGEGLAEVGTPAEFSDEAREGFVLYVDFLVGIEDGDVEELEQAEDPQEVFGDDAEKVTTFSSEASTTCAGELGDLQDELQDQMGDQLGDLEEQLGDLEGELPSDSPS